MTEPPPPLLELLQVCIDGNFSDLHISANAPPIGRLFGKLVPIGNDPWPKERVEHLVHSMTTPETYGRLEEEKALDSAWSLGQFRFRINTYKERGFYALALRKLDTNTKTMAELGLPQETYGLAKYPSGLILFTGPTGSGKSTSLAALIDHINTNQSHHIITIEDPIEYIHANKNSLIHQREVGTDVLGFYESLREALREDPDIILVGEMRDLDTIRAAVTAAETGHLVLSTLHSKDSVGALDRMIGMYPAVEQDSIKRQLSMALRAVVTQSLLPTPDGKGRNVAVEILKINNAVANLIGTGQFKQIYSILEISAGEGMLSMDHHLAELVHEGKVALELAMQKTRNEQAFRERLQFINRQGKQPDTAQQQVPNLPHTAQRG